MTPTQTETGFLQMSEEQRAQRLLALLIETLPHGFLQANYLASDVGIDTDAENWASTRTGKAFYAAVRKLRTEGDVDLAQDQLVFLTKKHKSKE